MTYDASSGPSGREARLILASGSPRRRELLDLVGIFHVVVPSDVDESARDEEPRALVRRLSADKAVAVARHYPSDLVLGADSVVVIDGHVLGKPSSPAHALAMLSRLQGRTHLVLTGVALVSEGGSLVADHVEQTDVAMHPASEDELRRYVEGGEPLDKAGAYAIQGEARALVAEITGCYANVVGLPLCVVCRWLAGRGRPCRSVPLGRCRKADAFCPLTHQDSATLA